MTTSKPRNPFDDDDEPSAPKPDPTSVPTPFDDDFEPHVYDGSR